MCVELPCMSTRTDAYKNTNTPVQSSIYNMKLSEKCQLLVRKGEFGDKNYMTLLRLKDGDYTFISFPLEVSAFIMEEIEHIKICIQSGLPRYFPMFGYSFMRHRKFNIEVIDFRGTFYLCLSQEHSKTYSKLHQPDTARSGGFITEERRHRE